MHVLWLCRAWKWSVISKDVPGLPVDRLHLYKWAVDVWASRLCQSIIEKHTIMSGSRGPGQGFKEVFWFIESSVFHEKISLIDFTLSQYPVNGEEYLTNEGEENIKYNNDGLVEKVKVEQEGVESRGVAISSLESLTREAKLHLSASRPRYCIFLEWIVSAFEEQMMTALFSSDNNWLTYIAKRLELRDSGLIAGIVCKFTHRIMKEKYNPEGQLIADYDLELKQQNCNVAGPLKGAMNEAIDAWNTGVVRLFLDHGVDCDRTIPSDLCKAIDQRRHV